MATATRRKIDQVLASARKDLEAQLGVVRAEMARLTAEERELTQTLASLGTDGGPSAPTRASAKRPASARNGKPRRGATGRRPRSRRTASKSTAERVDELRALLAEGPRSRGDLAASLKVSPARVQQLLGELGSSVSSQPASDRRGKLWSIRDAENGARADKPQAGRGRGKAKRSSGEKPRARKGAATK
jgi:hypothetical protein